jgi:hypothetical protein
MTIASITSSSPAPAYACTIIASASRAGQTGGCPFRAIHIRPGQLGLKLLVKQLMPVLSEEDQQLRPPHRIDHRLLRRRRLHRRTPDTRAHPTSLLVAKHAQLATNTT